MTTTTIPPQQPEPERVKLCKAHVYHPGRWTKQDHLLKTSFAAMEWPARERKVRDVQVAIQFVEALP